MYWNEIMSHKARTLVAKLRRQSRVRPYRERAEITPLLSHQNGHKKNGTSAININNGLYPILEVYEGEQHRMNHSKKYQIRNKKKGFISSFSFIHLKCLSKLALFQCGSLLIFRLCR